MGRAREDPPRKTDKTEEWKQKEVPVLQIDFAFFFTRRIRHFPFKRLCRTV